LNVKEWIRRFESADAREEFDEVDFTALGEELGKDTGLSDQEYEEVLRGIAAKLFSNQFSTVLDYCLEHRRFPSEDTWIEIVMQARDWEVGGKILSALLPYVNLTKFVCKLLGQAKSTPLKEHRRISFSVWAAACGGSISIPTGDEFAMREAVDCEFLAREVERWLPTFTERYDREALQTALRCLRSRA
jgi:hypothetical protein